jgi:hypothetical protein
MIRVAIVDQDGKVLSPKDLATAVELREVARQAGGLIRDCERLAKLKDPKAPATKPQGGVPYL